MSKKEIDSIINLFNPISLSEMDKVKFMNRIDTKFVFTYKKLSEIISILTHDYFILKVKNSLISRYESLYYDCNLNHYNDHHRKKNNRYKIRYRTYKDSKITFLEVKHKKKGRTIKSRIPVDKIKFDIPDDHFNFIKEVNPNFSRPEPSLMNNFNRITLVNKRFNERLTIDLELGYKWKNRTKQIDNIVIAELKQNNTNRNSPFYKLMKDNYIRPLKISKYCIGIIDMYGKNKIKYNRFKKKILKLNKLQANAS